MARPRHRDDARGPARDARDERELRRAAEVAEHELVAWARRLGVEEHLADPIGAIVAFVDDRDAREAARFAETRDVRSAALGRVGSTELARRELGHAARRYLEACAEEEAQQARRAMLWRREPEHPSVARVARVLRNLERDLAARSRGPDRIRASDVRLDASVPALVLRPGAPRGGSELRLVLAGHARDEIVLEPEPPPSPSRATALVRIALDAIHDPSHALHAELTGALIMPAWRRLVSSMDASLAEAAEIEARVVFRAFRRDDGDVDLQAVLQRRRGRGWTKGTRVEGGAELRQVALDAPTALALRALDAAVLRRGRASEALYALAEGGVVLRADGSSPLSVSRVEARFALAEEAGGVRPALALGDVRVSAEQIAARLEGASCVAHLEAGGDVVLVAAIGAELARLLRVSAEHSAVIPDAERGAILPMVERVAERVPVALSAALEEEVEPLEPELFLRVEPDEVGANVEIRTRLSAGTSARAGEGATLVSCLLPGAARPVLRRRDLAREQHAAETLARELHMTEGETRAHLATTDALLALLATLHERTDVAVEWPDARPRARFVGSIGRAGLRVRVESAAEWFGVEGEIEIDGEVVSLAELLAQVRAGRRFVLLSRGRFAAIEADLRARLEHAADAVFPLGRGAEAELRVVPTAGDALEALLEEGALEADAAWARMRARLAAGALVDAPVPGALTATLRDYQRAGFVWLARLASIEAGAVLADDMGLGKTVQALALLVHRAGEGPALVIAPTSLGDNWAREAARFAPSLRVRVHRGPARHGALEADPPRPSDLVIASYDVVALDLEALRAIGWSTMVLDEAQNVKNPEAQRTKAARSLRARMRVALTGTPLENRLSDLWSIFSIVHPGLLGTWEHFRARFAQPIERDGDRERLAALSALARPYLLRRTKEVVTPELPPRIEIVREVELTDAERRLYEAERAAALTALAGAGEDQRFRVLATITRLRELACDASLVVPGADVTSSKLVALMDLVDELEAAGRRVLVFSQFVRLLERAAELLRGRGTSYLQLDGSTPPAERARRVDRFQRGEATVFLLSLKAGGAGLNLTAADHVVHLDPWWNPAVEDQASDRAHRIGQDKPVTIVRLVAKDTIEEAVLSLHEGKRALTRGVLEGADAAGTIGARELVELIRASHDHGGRSA